MKTISITLVLSELLCCASLFSASDYYPQSMVIPSAALIEDKPSKTTHWRECFAQYSWPRGHNIMLDPNVRETGSGNNWTPLHVAVHHGHPKIVKMLLENGAILVKDAHARFPYELDASEVMPAKLVEYSQAAALVKAVWPHDWLHVYRFQWTDADVLENPNCPLIETNGDTSNPTPIRWLTPLHYAMFFSDFSMMQTLLKRGALPLRDSSGRFPHEMPNNFGGTKINYDKAKALARAVLKATSPMHSLVREYNTEFIAKAAATDPASINACDISKRTPLMYLIIGHECQIKDDDAALLETVQTLLKHGAKTDCVDSFGKTALHYLAESKNESIVREELLTLLA